MATQTSTQTFTLGPITVASYGGFLSGEAHGGDTTPFDATFSCASVRWAGSTYKATVAASTGWSLTKTGPQVGGAYPGTVVIGPGLVITARHQVFNPSTPCAPVTGSPATLGTVTVTGSGSMSATPGPGSVFTASASGLGWTTAGLWGPSVGTGTTGTWSGSFFAAGVTVW